ncbi:MAG: hypothetical protein SFU91_15115 [Chloroherpetonaceae bacterium]|nr:hypothetical protein [Chloroherpetonaceae bacterium]
MNKASLLRIILILQIVSVSIYTIIAGSNEGWDLFSVFFGNIKVMGWNGQFNLDFSTYLLLSGLWIMWRNNFSISSIAFGFAAMVLGIIAFAGYVLYLSYVEKGDVKKILVGER